jgi:hypothetical protein
MPHYKQEPQSVFENCSYKRYFDWSTTTDRTVHNNRPDRVMLDKTIKKAYLLELAIPDSHNL